MSQQHPYGRFCRRSTRLNYNLKETPLDGEEDVKTTRDDGTGGDGAEAATSIKAETSGSGVDKAQPQQPQHVLPVRANQKIRRSSNGPPIPSNLPKQQPEIREGREESKAQENASGLGRGDGGYLVEGERTMFSE